MWEKISKILIQNVIAIVIISGCMVVVFIGTFYEFPEKNLPLLNKFFDMSLVGVIGWLFTQSKSKSQQ